jgi:ATP-dependent Clp protease adaptor protein ClpS
VDSPLAEAEIKTKTDEPKRFVVYLINDDYTTMEFVIEVLIRFFGKTHEQAYQITMAVHHQGRGAAGVYRKEVAETKILQVTDLAKSRGHPLLCEMEPE